MCYNESFIWAQITTPLTLSSLLASGQFTEKKASLNAGTQGKKGCILISQCGQRLIGVWRCVPLEAMAL